MKTVEQRPYTDDALALFSRIAASAAAFILL